MDPDERMSDEEFLADRREALRESVRYFSSKGKQERERWVCTQFLLNFGLNFAETEVQSSQEEPPDVTFRAARFEIKEVMDPDRRRHAEYKASLEFALRTSNPDDLLNEFTPKDITPTEVASLVREQLHALSSKYEPRLCATLDLLFYVNLEDHFLTKSGDLPDVADFSVFGWRSVSVLIGWDAIILHARPAASEFLRQPCRRITRPSG